MHNFKVGDKVLIVRHEDPFDMITDEMADMIGDGKVYTIEDIADIWAGFEQSMYCWPVECLELYNHPGPDPHGLIALRIATRRAILGR